MGVTFLIVVIDLVYKVNINVGNFLDLCNLEGWYMSQAKLVTHNKEIQVLAMLLISVNK